MYIKSVYIAVRIKLFLSTTIKCKFSREQNKIILRHIMCKLQTWYNYSESERYGSRVLIKFQFFMMLYDVYIHFIVVVYNIIRVIQLITSRRHNFPVLILYINITKKNNNDKFVDNVYNIGNRWNLSRKLHAIIPLMWHQPPRHVNISEETILYYTAVIATTLLV